MAEQRPAEAVEIEYLALEQLERARRIDLARAELGRFVGNLGQDELAQLYHIGLPEEEGGFPKIIWDEESGSWQIQRSERLRILKETAAKYWDFRKNAERQETNWNIEGELGQEDSNSWKTVFAAADKLGEVESSKPKNRTPSYLVILGGMNKAPDDRLRYGLESVDDFGMLVYLGSSRPVSDAEREKAKAYAPNAQTEFELGCGALETRLNARLVSQDTIARNGDTWAWKEYEFEVERERPDGTKSMITKSAFALSTPREVHANGDQPRRANTYDNLRFFADRAELASDPDATVVAVTTAFYALGQHLPAIQELTLPYGTQVETIGHNAAYSGATSKPAQLLQENKAGIDAAVRLEHAIAKELLELAA